MYLMRPICTQLNNDGFVDLGITDPCKGTHDVARDIATSIGELVASPVERMTATPLGVKPLNTYGGNFGCSELPLHSDLAHWHCPPRYLLLRCVIGFPSVSTRLLHCHDLERLIPATLMRRALFSPRRRLDGRMYLLRMLSRNVLRWDSLFLSPKNLPGHEVVDRMASELHRLPMQHIFLSEPGHTLLLDNWRVLHGRSAVPFAAMDRSIDRTYLDSLENGH